MIVRHLRNNVQIYYACNCEFRIYVHSSLKIANKFSHIAKRQTASDISIYIHPYRTHESAIGKRDLKI